MRRAAVPIVAPVLIVAALLIAGCGGQAANHAGPGNLPYIARLCVVAGIPASGSSAAPAASGASGAPGASGASASGAAAGELLKGLRALLPSRGLRLGGYSVRLCHVERGSPVDNALAAARTANTIVYIGELTSAEAAVAGAILAHAGIPMVTPAQYDPATPPSGRANVAYLQPATGTQARAVRHVISEHRCDQRRHGRPRCTVVTGMPLCTGIGAAPAGGVPRYCVVAGPALTNGQTPASAYGSATAQLLITALHAVAAAATGGGASAELARRPAVLRALLAARLRASAIGPVRFTPQGLNENDLFTVYTVEPDGALVPSQSFRTH